MFSSRKKGLISLVNGFVVDLPSPSSLSYFWNFGSLLGLFLGFQIVSGLFLSFHFSSDLGISFFSVVKIMRDVEYGWLMRFVHANGASMYFMFIYIHMGRGLYYGSYHFTSVWNVGVLIYLVSMMVAFLGYVLPWGQMSYWAATVITNLLSVVPYVGFDLVEWVWGGFSVGNPTLIRFFSFHFVFPFVVLMMVIFHLYFLHESGSGNSLGLWGEGDKLSFHFYYSVSDIFGVFLVLVGFVYFCLLDPYLFMDSENFIYFNPLVTPVHIQPEWYFLFAYAILRSVPSKVGGVLALLMSVLILFLVPFIFNHLIRSTNFYGVVKMMFWSFIIVWVCLGWLGSCEVEYPYDLLASVFSILYFMSYFNFSVLFIMQDYLLD